MMDTTKQDRHQFTSPSSTNPFSDLIPREMLEMIEREGDTVSPTREERSQVARKKLTVAEAEAEARRDKMEMAFNLREFHYQVATVVSEDRSHSLYRRYFPHGLTGATTGSWENQVAAVQLIIQKLSDEHRPEIAMWKELLHCAVEGYISAQDNVTVAEIEWELAQNPELMQPNRHPELDPGSRI